MKRQCSLDYSRNALYFHKPQLAGFCTASNSPGFERHSPLYSVPGALLRTPALSLDSPQDRT